MHHDWCNSDDVIPGDLQLAFAGTFRRHGDRQLLHRESGLRNLHLRAPEVRGLVVLERTPLVDHFIENERPLLLVRNRKKAVLAFFDVQRAEHQVAFRSESSRLVRASAPDFSVGFKSPEDLALFLTRSSFFETKESSISPRKEF